MITSLTDKKTSINFLKSEMIEAASSLVGIILFLEDFKKLYRRNLNTINLIFRLQKFKLNIYVK